MAFWEIEHKGTRQSAEAWGVTMASRRVQSMTPDVLTLEIVDVPDVDGVDNIVLRDLSPIELRDASPVEANPVPPFSYGDTIKVYRNNLKWFQGIVTKLPWIGDQDGSEGQTFEISGPWWYLENLVFQQNWSEIDLDASVSGSPVELKSALRSHVLLGMNDAGTLITTGDQLDAILAYVIASVQEAGLAAPFGIGNVLAGQQVWSVEGRDQTCAEVVRSIMRWHPGAVASFDYSAETPILHIVEPTTLYELDATDRRVVSTRYTHRKDLVPPFVQFKYEKDHDFDGNTYTTVESDIYPADATGRAPGGIVATIPLRGSARSHQKQKIRTRAIPTGTTSLGFNGGYMERWMRDHLPWLNNFAFDDWIVGGFTVEFARPSDSTLPEAIDPENTLADSTDPADYPRELLDGNIEDWMGVRAERLRIDAIIAYDNDPQTAASKAIFTDQIDVGGTPYPAIRVSIEVTGTNAQNKVYKKVVKSAPAEATPTGLAQAYYESLDALPYEGTITLIDEEAGSVIDDPGAVTLRDGTPIELRDGTDIIPDGPPAVGQKVKLVDGTAVLIPGGTIQTISQDLQTGRDTITFGPSEHLSPQDFLESLRLARMLPKQTFRTRDEEPDESPQSIGGHQAPRSNTTTEPAINISQGFGYTIEKGGKILVEDGDLTEDGDTVHNCDPGAAKAITGTEQLWVIADTDKDGAITAVTTEWRTSKPTGLKKHTPDNYDAPGSSGDVGKYAWHILDATNSSGKITVVYYRHGVEYYSDRARHKQLPDVTVADSGKVPRVDSSGTILMEYPSAFGFGSSGSSGSRAAPVPAAAPVPVALLEHQESMATTELVGHRAQALRRAVLEAPDRAGHRALAESMAIMERRGSMGQVAAQEAQGLAEAQEPPGHLE